MSDRKMPENLLEHYTEERVRLYDLLWKIEDALTALTSGNVSSYSLGNRSLTYQNLSELRTMQKETEARIEAVEARLRHAAPRCVTTNVFLDPSITLIRR